MGYIVNAKGRRVGWTYKWCDVFYSENIYYPEFIHIIYRLRYYLIYYFTGSIIEKAGIFYSHFMIVQSYKKLIVSVFWYDGHLEQDYSDYLFYWFKDLYMSQILYKPKDRRLPLHWFNCYKLFPWLLFFLKGDRRNLFARRKMTFKEHKFRIILKRLKFTHWQLKLKQLDINDKTNLKFRHENKLRKKVRNKFLYYFNYSAKAKVYETVSENTVKVTEEPLTCNFFFNIKKIRTLPYFFNKKKLYVIYQLPFLKQVLRSINKAKIWYFYKYVRTIFLKDHISYKSLFFKLKVSLIFLIYIYIVAFSKRGLGSHAKGGRDRLGAAQIPMDTLIKRFYFVWVLSAGQGGKMLMFLKKIFYMVFRYLVYWQLKIKFYIISNDEVTAKFLSRFIARKLAKHFSLRDVLSPIKLELARVRMSHTSIADSWASRVFKWSVYLNKKRSHRKKLFQKVLSYSIISYKKILLFFYNIYFIIISVDMMLVYIWLYKKYKLNKQKLKGISLHYNRSRSKLNQYLGFYNIKLNKSFSSLSYKNYSFISMLIPINVNNKNYNMKKYIINFKDFRANICIDFIYSLNIFYLNKIYFIAKSKAVRAACWHMGRYLKFNYWKDNIAIVQEAIGLNNLNSRKYKTDQFSYLLGYKMHFQGRFTRRQRSKHYWYHQGRVPISKVMANIDFGYFVIPLVNSAVSVKIWMHRSAKKDKLYTILV